MNGNQITLADRPHGGRSTTSSWRAVAFVIALAAAACTQAETPVPPSAPAPSPTDDVSSGNGNEDGPEGADVGEVLALDALPGLPDEGAVIQLDEGLVFVGLDGTVHGHVPGATLETPHGLRHAPAGLVPVRDDELGAGWLEPSTGAWWPGHWGTPLIADAVVLLDPHAGSPDAYVIHRSDEALAEWERNTPWWLSADHRTVVWEQCADGTDAAACPMGGYDFDMGATLDLDPGCWVADSLGDFTQLRVCVDHDADPRSWLELVTPGEQPVRYELPRPDGMPDDLPVTSWFMSAELADRWVLAQARIECEVRKAWLIDVDTGDLHPVLGDESFDGASIALGWAADGRAAVLVQDGPCAEGNDQSGLWLVDPDGADPQLVYRVPAGVSAEAHLWGPVPGIDLEARADR